MKNKINYKLIAKNKRAFFDYEIKRRLIAGIVLSGPEVKSIRLGTLSLKGSFANFMNGELWANNIYISKYPHANLGPDYSPDRPRKLLLHDNELKRIVADKQNGLHVVVLSLGTMGKFIKIELGVGQSKKKYDKRQAIKSRSQLREAQKASARANQN